MTELLELFRMSSRTLLPEVRPSSGDFGPARQLGGIPIMGIAGDQQAAAFGQACWQPRHGEKHLWNWLLFTLQHRAYKQCHLTAPFTQQCCLEIEYSRK